MSPASCAVDVLLLRNTCGAFLETSSPLCNPGTEEANPYAALCMSVTVDPFTMHQRLPIASWKSPPSTEVTARARVALLTRSRASCL